MLNGLDHPAAQTVSISELGLTERPLNCLKRFQLNTVGDIVAYHSERIESGGVITITNFVRRSFDELVAKLEPYGIELSIPPGFETRRV